MLRKVRSFELSSAGLSDTGVEGGAGAEVVEIVELAVEGAGDAR